MNGLFVTALKVLSQKIFTLNVKRLNKVIKIVARKFIGLKSD